MEVIMYVIMGATGNTGNVVARTLLGLSQKVRAIGRSAERLEPLTAEGAEAFVCDVTDSVALSKAFSGARAIYAMIPPNLTSENYRADQEPVQGNHKGPHDVACGHPAAETEQRNHGSGSPGDPSAEFWGCSPAEEEMRWSFRKPELFEAGIL